MTMRRWLVTALVGLVSLPFIAQAQDFKPPSNLKSPAMIAEGRAFFNRRCAGRCHGVDGQEGEQNGSILVGKAYLDPVFVYVTLITGRPGSAMPSWKDRLSDDELWKVIAFMSSLGDQARGSAGK
jgi:mono/diheme cytochrome c family protein